MTGSARRTFSAGWARVRPLWPRTIRMRLTLTYSALLFGITAVLLFGGYLALSWSIIAAPLDSVLARKFQRAADGNFALKPGESFDTSDLGSVQRAINFIALQNLRDYSLLALAVMFVISVAIGWWAAGRALRPVGAITATAQDITATDLSRRINASGPHDELRTLADTIDGMLERLDRAFRAERMLVEDMSHELRNPVSIVQANVEAVLGNEASTALERREAGDVVLQATRRMSRLLEDLLATARLRSETFADRDIDLAGVAAAAAREHRLVSQRRGLRIHEVLHPGLIVYGDADALNRVLGNLLSNAIRLAPEGSTITVGTGSRDGWAWAAVGDEGPGIPLEAQDRVFDRFSRADETSRRGADSTGLGLAIARQIAESQEGKLVLGRSGPDGSTFVLWLPDRALDGTRPRSAAPPVGDPLRGSAGM
jgi:signal transduction histidine kinase